MGLSARDACTWTNRCTSSVACAVQASTVCRPCYGLAVGVALHLVRHRQVGASLSGLLPVVISEPTGPVASRRCRCSVECALTRPRSVWSGCDATDWRTTGRRQRKTTDSQSRLGLASHVRPVRRTVESHHTRERAIEIVESQTRNESEVYLYESGDPYTSVYGAPAGPPSAGLLFRSTAKGVDQEPPHVGTCRW